MKVFLCVLALFAFAYSQSTCTVCDFVVKGAEGLLANNLTESQIIHFLENGCALLPSPLSGECTSIVDTAGAAIIKDLIEGVDPEVVCAKFGFCASSKRAVSDVQQGGCSVCQLVVSYVESYLAQNQTEAQIIANLEQVCSLLGPLGSTCDQFVEQYVPQLIQWIEAGESPAVFCKQVGLCGASLKRDVQQGGCSVCQLVVSYVESYLEQNQTEAQIIANLEQVCSLLGPLGSTCDQFVEQYVPQLIQWIEAGESPAVFCKQVGLCSTVPKVKRDIQQGGCSVCQLVVSYVESYLAQNQTEAQIIANLEQVCSLLGPLGSTCDQFVEQYVPQLIQWIEAGESPAVFCKQVGLCGSQKRSVADAQQGGCSVCQLVVSYVESYLAQNQTEAQIIANLEQVCSLLGPLGSTCDQFVEQYVPQLIQWIEAGESPAVFCKQVGLCGSNKVKRDVQQGGCSVCQLVVSYVESYLEQNQTEAQIIAQLEQVCSLLGPLSSTCDQFVEQYVPQLIQWIEAGENPATFCKQIGLCTSSLKRDVQQGGCSVCQLVVSYVESYLEQNQTEAQIIANLEQVCSLLGPLGSTCDQFVEQYVPQLIQWIEAGESPAVFCKQVGLCSSSLKRDVEQSGGCSVCQLVVSYVENFLKSNGSVTQLEQELDQLCSLLGPLASTCDDFVALYTLPVVDWILSNEPPQAFCAQVGLCSAPSKAKVQPKKVVATIKSGKNLKAGANCGLCELVVQYVELYVAQSTTEKQIVASVEQLCTFLPASVERQCNSIVEANVPKLIQYLISKENPLTFCTQVGLCPQ